MLPGFYGDLVEGVWVNVPDVEWSAVVILETHFQHLVEVAVVDFSEEGCVDGVPAHEAFDGGGVEGFLEELLVVFELVVALEV